MSKNQAHLQEQLQEEVIAEYPYKPFGWLTVTSKRLIFKKFLWINTFSGIIQLSDIKSVKLIKEKSLFAAVPRFEFTYLDSTHKSVRTTEIYLPSFATRIGLEISRGVTPESLHKMILELLKTHED